MYTPRFTVVWAEYRRTFIGLAITALVVLVGWLVGLKASIIAATAALVGLLSQAFVGLMGLLALIPWLGPLLVKALSLPFIWLMNGAGYFASILLAKRGYTRSVVDARVLTVVLLTGIVIGYILGKII
jgi:hypothetical protein